MEVKGILRRTQSLRNVSSDSKLSISDAGLRDRQKSVSQLVAEYRFSVKRKPVDSGQEKQEPTPLIIYTPPIDKKAIKPAPPVEKNDIQSRPGLPDEVRPLQRSRSMNSLPRWGSVSTNALRELFESKVTTPKVLRHKSMTPKTPAENGNVRVFDDGKKDSEEHTDKEKVLKGTEKAVKSRHLERQTSTGAFDLGRTSEELCNNEKHTPAAGSGDSDIFYGWDKSAISVKALSALYLSKVAAFGSSIKPAQYSGVPGSKATKFQPAVQDMCAACQRPVYPMEKMVADKFIFHNNCFCCKHCKKKLSLHNFTPLYGEFYCIFHYQQLFRTKGNYDEGFGHTQHKNRWLQRNIDDGDLIKTPCDYSTK
ncbi:F-actin-monooxygenase Mical isoform X6 [Denticeps clupeoides]|uniref:LIM zinc-binding domain-containing protein n=1 Tax=Denticeps clupeoides TaxID=299321 RepID=A0AAY4BBR7_9TELE|nr:F-actin-monooxygenase Mical-like isoform X6 [Denticeps clupeoides]